MVAPQLDRSGGTTALLTKAPQAYWKKSAHGSAGLSIHSGTMPLCFRLIGAAGRGGVGGRIGAGASGASDTGGGWTVFPPPHEATSTTESSTERMRRGSYHAPTRAT